MGIFKDLKIYLKSFKKFVFATSLALTTLSSTCFFNNYNLHAKESTENENLAYSTTIASGNDNKSEKETDTVEKILSVGEITSNKNGENDKKSKIETENSKNKKEKIDQELEYILENAGIKEVLKHLFRLVFNAAGGAVCGFILSFIPPFSAIPHLHLTLPSIASISSLVWGIIDCYDKGVEEKVNQLLLKSL